MKEQEDEHQFNHAQNSVTNTVGKIFKNCTIITIGFVINSKRIYIPYDLRESNCRQSKPSGPTRDIIRIVIRIV
jgi:hypothetical protein